MIMQQTLTAGFTIKLDDSAKGTLSQALEISPNDLESYLKPKESDYAMIPVRALSATNVQNSMFNFGHLDGKPLKDALPLFDGLTILKDHNFSVDYWLGTTERPYWDSLTPDVPPGVNLMMKIDTKADPKVARGLIAGTLQSVSVTVAFEYDKSHPKMSDMEFYMQLGDTVDGKVVQALVTKITRLYELSVVWQGADQYAKVPGADGRIHVPGTARNSLQENQMDWKKFIADLGLTGISGEPTEATVLTALKGQIAQVTTLQAANTALTAEKQTLSDKITVMTTQNAAVTTELEAKKAEVVTLTSKVTELTNNAKLGEDFLKARRGEALRLYNLVEADKATDVVRAVISASELPVAESFITSYQARAEQLAPLTCSSCGSTEVNRKKSEQAAVPGNEGRVSKLASDRLKASVDSIHG